MKSAKVKGPKQITKYFGVPIGTFVPSFIALSISSIELTPSYKA